MLAIPTVCFAHILENCFFEYAHGYVYNIGMLYVDFIYYAKR